MLNKRPYVLCIGGLDPSGGAGILADVKTMESCRVNALAIACCNTAQNENEFDSIVEIDLDLIKNQIDLLFKLYPIEWVKIGLVPSMSYLENALEYLKDKSVKIIWDPILSASVGFNFKHDYSKIKNQFSQVYLATPNAMEVARFSESMDVFEASEHLSRNTQILMKGGHFIDKNKGVDFLYTNGKLIRKYNPKRKDCTPKHGSGCVFASALTAHLAKGFPLHKAILKAKGYTESFLSSNNTLLGFHKL